MIFFLQSLGISITTENKITFKVTKNEVIIYAVTSFVCFHRDTEEQTVRLGLVFTFQAINQRFVLKMNH